MNGLQLTTGEHSQTFAYCDGDGPPIVMLHGMDSSADCWTYVYQQLKAHHRVIAPDLPGHGRSTGGLMMPYSLDYYTCWLSDFLDSLKLPVVTLVGHSMGGAISLAFARLHPERLNRLIVVSSLGLSRKFPWTGARNIAASIPDYVRAVLSHRNDPYLLRFFQPWGILDPWGSSRDIIQQIAVLNRPRQTAVLWSGLRLLAANFLSQRERDHFVTQLSQMTIPTLIIWGRHDGLLPLEEAYEGISRIEGAALEILENSAHEPMLEEPLRFNTIVQEFLSRPARGFPAQPA